MIDMNLQFFGGRGSRGSRGGSGSTKSYDEFDKTVVDTLIVQRNGKYQIEQYKGQNLDEYDYVAELNHDKLSTIKVMDNKPGYSYMKDISFDDIFSHLKKHYNFKG